MKVLILFLVFLSTALAYHNDHYEIEPFAYNFTNPTPPKKVNQPSIYWVEGEYISGEQLASGQYIYVPKFDDQKNDQQDKNIVLAMKDLVARNACRDNTAYINLLSTGEVLFHTRCEGEDKIMTRVEFSERFIESNLEMHMRSLHIDGGLTKCHELAHTFALLETAEIKLETECIERKENLAKMKIQLMLMDL